MVPDRWEAVFSFRSSTGVKRLDDAVTGVFDGLPLVADTATLDPPVDAVFTWFFDSLFLLLDLTSCILHGILWEDLHIYLGT